MLRPAVHLPNQSVLVDSPQSCLKTSSPGVQWAWEPLFKSVDFSGWLEPKSLGCKTSCPSFPITLDCLCRPLRARCCVRARVQPGAWLLNKVQMSGPSCHLPAALRDTVTRRRRPGSQKKGEDIILISCPALSFLRSHSGETCQAAVPLQGERQSFRVGPSTLPVSWCPAEPGVRKSPTVSSILLH